MSLADLEKLGAFYLGRTERGPYLLDARHLTTHGVVIGMTGSGKTGLSIALLEEAAIDGIPAIVVDPKGDLGNLLLTFPELSPDAFAPWVPPGADAGAEAAKWREGLAAWEQDGARIARLRATADVALYTPGSRAGRPLSILASLAAPPPALREDKDAMAERVSQVATSLLGLVGVKAEPGRSREHALVSAILARAWAAGEDLDVEGLVARVQDPPFAKVGVLDLESFFPKKERFELAVAYNGLVASPGFEAWLEGEPLDVDALLWTKEGKPRVSILSIAHLGDAERMFFVSLLLGELVSWIRRQPGTPSLRALFFMDEVVGYFPPVAVPPSKPPLLLLLKQARAYGLGIVLATQNPVDLDYKGLANAGTWLIGRLQTERDKARVIEGLEGAAAGGRFDRAAVERQLAGLERRRFYVHSVHEPEPLVLESRWTMSYLRGPLTREEIRKLSAPPQSGTVALPAKVPAASAPAASAAGGRPVLPPGIREVFFPTTKPAPVYRPFVVGAARVSFEDAKTKLDFSREVMFVTPATDGPVPLRWEDAKWAGQVTARDLGTEPAPGARFLELPASMLVAKSYPAWSKELVAWLARTQGIARWRSDDVWSLPNEDPRIFRARLAQSSREARDEAVAKVSEKYQAKLEALAEKIRAKQATLAREEAEANASKVDAALSAGAGILAMLGGSRRGASGVASAARGANRAKKAASDVTRAKESLDALVVKYRALEEEARAALAEAARATDPSTVPLEHVVTKPKKSGIAVQLCALAWMPS